MNPLGAFAMLITTAQCLVAAVSTRDNLHVRPAVARQSVALRLASGLAVLRAFLRRLIILAALEMEWDLVDVRAPMRRPHGRKATPLSPRFTLKALDGDKVSPWLNGDGPQFKAVLKTDDGQGRNPPVYVDMAKLYAQLDYLATIAANPSAKAKRLAFHLARTRPGIIMAPKGPQRLAGHWGTQISTTYSAMAASIMERSRIRPPPLAPPRTHWPTITAF